MDWQLYQKYRVHLMNGDVIEVSELYDISESCQNFADRYVCAEDDEAFVCEDDNTVGNYHYVLKKNIAYITMGEVIKGVSKGKVLNNEVLCPERYRLIVQCREIACNDGK